MKHGDSGEFGNWQAFSVLIVDDEAGMRNFLERALRSRCGRVEAASSVEEAVEWMARLHFDLVILDIALPGKTGIEWLNELRHGGFTGDIVMITAFADLETAIHALRGGASDFVLKPFRVDQILNSIKRCFEGSRLARENYILRRKLADHDREVAGMIGHSESILQLCALVRRVAPLPTTVLLSGESGTGKEVTARALHQMSPRAERPFVPVNCAAISGELIEAELFGHVKGAFTGATDSRNGLFYYAHGGTLFLDEIGELPLGMQTKLLRVLEEHCVRPVGSEREIPVDVRIIAASNRDLAADVADGCFRTDLFYRLAVVEMRIPALRERVEDIPELVRHFMAQFAARLGVEPLELMPAVVRRLSAYDWPGNVRELRNYVERSMILGGFQGVGGGGGAVALDSPCAPQRTNPAALTLAELERRHIETVLEATRGNKSEAARRLGIARKTLERKLAEWELAAAAAHGC
jgi:DNA-binding NtrC family response regulator